MSRRLSPPFAIVLGAGCIIGLLTGAPSPAVAQDNVSRPANQSRLSDDERTQASNSSDDASSPNAEEATDDDNDVDETSEDNEAPPTSEDATEPIQADDPVEYCNQFMVPYLESAARKLYRALAGRSYRFEALNLQDWVDLEARQSNGESRTVEFEVFRQKEGKVASLIDAQRDYRRTYVVAMLDAGPLIVSYRWPTADVIGQRGDCRPLDSRIEYPIVPVDNVDPEPFKFWGLRVIWRLPKSFDRGDQDRENLYETLDEVLSSERNASHN